MEYLFIVIMESIETNIFYERNVKAVFLVLDFLLEMKSEISLFSRS